MSPKDQISKSGRAALARKTVIHTIPAVLQASSRARAGVQAVQLLRDEQPISATAHHQSLSSPVIRVVAEDTLQAAYDLSRAVGPQAKVTVLSMASELRPGGGFLSGANSQEESLCMRTTLYASLREQFYRLPELGCVFTPDVCVFRGRYDRPAGLLVGGSGSNKLPSAATATTGVSELNPTTQWWFVDVISCAAVRGPDHEDNRYANPAQRDLMREKIKRLLRVATTKQCRRLVLGAFGCGAFDNPPGEVAELFRRVLLGRDGSGKGKNGGEFVGCFDEIVFAIKGGRKETFEQFCNAFPGPST